MSLTQKDVITFFALLEKIVRMYSTSTFHIPVGDTNFICGMGGDATIKGRKVFWCFDAILSTSPVLIEDFQRDLTSWLKAHNMKLGSQVDLGKDEPV